VTDAPAVAPLRLAVRFYIALTSLSAAASLAVGLWFAGPLSVDLISVMVCLTLLLIVACLRPLRLSRQVQVNLTAMILIAALLTLEPGHALLVTMIGALTASSIRRVSAGEALFNTAQLTLHVAAGAAVCLAAGWSNQDNDFAPFESIFVTLAAGTVMHLVNTLSLTGVISLQQRIRFFGVWFDLTLRTNRAEIVTYVAQLGIGLLGAIIATERPWALTLLIIPAAAVHFSLSQHTAMRRRAEANLAEAQHLASLGSWDWDLRTGEQHWSDELFRITGLSPTVDVANGEAYLRLVHPDDRATVAAALGAAAAAGLSFELEHRMFPADAHEERFIHANAEVLLGRRGRPERVVGTVHDITERKRLEQRLEFQAYHDPLTGLPNREYFQQRLEYAIAQADRRLQIAVLFLDLDRFKHINDTFGHDAGDSLLQTVAARLTAAVRPGDMVARIGGDEFTILLHKVAGEREAKQTARRIIHAINVPVLLPGEREVVVSTSIGIALPGAETRQSVDYMRDADNALYRAKESGRNQYVLFDAAMGAETQDRVALEADLRRAIERNELLVMYQPKIDLASGQRLRSRLGARWNHPERGRIAPSAFIEIAKEIGLIQQIGQWVLREACQEAVRWPAGRGTPLSVSVNLSARQLHDTELVSDLQALLTETALPPGRLILEITETIAMQDADGTIAALERLNGLGVRAVIDEFGTGYSSLSSLQRFPVQALQLDRTFVANLGRIWEAATIAHAVIGLAHGLGLRVVAVGVERPEQLTHLIELGCEEAQGNLFAAPMTARGLMDYLDAQMTLPLHLPDVPHDDATM
jgi:diguanylate cyclase (GGDEF)-like protein